jgi:hypothetical protein
VKPEAAKNLASDLLGSKQRSSPPLAERHDYRIFQQPLQVAMLKGRASRRMTSKWAARSMIILSEAKNIALGLTPACEILHDSVAAVTYGRKEPIEILGSPAASSLGGSFIRFEKSS